MQEESLMLKPLYYNQEVLTREMPIIFRHDVKGHRKYYTMSKDYRYIEKTSVTTMLDKVMPTPFWLVKWRAELGLQEADKLMKQSGKYGTLMHICIEDYLDKKSFDFGTLEARITTYIMTERITFDTWNWKEKLEHDIYAFHHFCNDYQVEPIAIEIMLISEKLGYGGAIDLVCKMRIGTGENGKVLKSDMKIDKNGQILVDKTREVYAIVDFKSGRHGFSESNEAQVHMYKNLFNEYFPFIPIEKVFNWAPKDWDKSSTPAYFLKDQTNSVEADLIPLYVEIFNKKDLDAKSKDYHVFDGVIELGAINDSKNLRIESYEQRAVKRMAPKLNQKTNVLSQISNESSNIQNEVKQILNEVTQIPNESSKIPLTPLNKGESEEIEIESVVEEAVPTVNIVKLNPEPKPERKREKRESLLKSTEIKHPDWTQADIQDIENEESSDTDKSLINHPQTISQNETVTITSSQTNSDRQTQTFTSDNNFGIEIEEINQANVDKVTKQVESTYNNIFEILK